MESSYLAENRPHPAVHAGASFPHKVIDLSQLFAVKNTSPVPHDEVADSIQGVGSLIFEERVQGRAASERQRESSASLHALRVPYISLLVLRTPHFSVFFPTRLFYLRPSLSCSLPSRNSDPGSHSRLFSYPPPHCGTGFAFCSSRKEFSTFFPRRLAATLH